MGASLAVIAAPAIAQDDTVAKRATIEQIIRDHPANAGRAAEDQKVIADQLNYDPSPEVRRRNLERFIDTMRAQNRSNAAQLTAYFENTDVMAVIDRRMRWTGDATPNVAEALAVWWVGAWIVNQEPSMRGVTSETMQIVRDQAAAVLLSSLKAAELNDTQKQEMAENFLLNMVVLQESLKAAGDDPAIIAQLAEELHWEALAQGIDLSAIMLTDQGFILIDR